MDPNELIPLASAFGSAQMAVKLFGPTLEYFGTGIRNFTEKRIKNLQAIFSKAEKRIPSEEQEAYVSIDPMLARTVVEYGSFSEDELIQEYLAGLLVSSRIGLAGDNRAATMAKVVESLSVYQIRAHYLVYSLFRKKFSGTGVSLNFQSTRSDLQFYIPHSLFERFVLVDPNEREISNALVDHTIHGLARNALIEQSFVIGSPAHISTELKTKAPPEHGVVLQVSPFGIELFLWISAVGKKSMMNRLIDPTTKIPELIDFNGVDLNKVYRCPE